MCFSCVALSLGLRTFYYMGDFMSKAFGDNLRKIRIRKGYTQEEMAKLLYINRTTYTKYETGDNEPDLQTLQRLCELLEVDYNTLLNY